MTIGFNHLGRHGRLGNQMFQYAGLRGIAAHRGLDFMIPSSDFKDPYQDHQLFEAFKLKGLTNIGICAGPYVQEAHFHFDQNLYNNMPDGHNVFGYLQTTKYFNIIEKEIREDFEFKNKIMLPCEEMIGTIQDPIALHVRHGDYGCENHPICSKEYYDTALSKLLSKYINDVVIFLILSAVSILSGIIKVHLVRSYDGGLSVIITPSCHSINQTYHVLLYNQCRTIFLVQ